MDSKKETPPIIDQFADYVETRIKLAKYQAIETGSSFAANIITDLVLIVSILLTFFFASLTLAYFLGELLNGIWKGFGIIALLYLIIVLVLKFNRKNVEKPLINIFIQKIFKSK